MDKREAASLLSRLAFAHELVGNAYKARAYTSAVWPIRNLDGDIAALHASGRLEEIRGVGKSTVRVVGQALRGEEPAELAALEAQIPEGVRRIGRLRGLGPKKVKAVWKELEITSLAELEYACTENRLVDLPGFGAKTQAKVLRSVQEARRTEGLFTRDRVAAVYSAVVPDLRERAERVIAVGAWRLGRELVDGLDLLVVGEVDVPDANEGVPVRVFFTDLDDFGIEAVRRSAGERHLEALVALGLNGLEGSFRHESEVYGALGLHVPPPELRDGAALIPVSGPRPRLVRREDLVGALHNHTVASDGVDTLAAMKAAAELLDLQYLGISEHSVSASYARGLDETRLASQVTEIVRLNEDGGCQILTGIESDIRADGSLDYEDAVLASVEVVIASVHARHGQSGVAMTERMVKAARNPRTAIVGHPTGRLLLGRPPSEYDVGAMLDAAAESGCAVELNASPHRLDLNEVHLAMAKERCVLVAISPDAHSTRALANLDYGVSIARRAGLGPSDVLNTRSLEELRAWLPA